MQRCVKYANMEGFRRAGHIYIVDGALGKDAALFLGRIAEQLSGAWGRGYGNVLG